MGLIVNILNLCIYLYYILLILRILMPFFRHPPNHPLVRLLRLLTEPPLAVIRKALPPKWMGGVDYSIFILIILLFLLQRIMLFVLTSV